MTTQAGTTYKLEGRLPSGLYLFGSLVGDACSPHLGLSVDGCRA